MAKCASLLNIYSLNTCNYFLKMVMRTKTKEEMIVLLYTLHVCGGSPSKGRAIGFITENKLIRETTDDKMILDSGESKVANRIAWARQDLKDRGLLEMPQHGKWTITGKGRSTLFRLAVASLKWDENFEICEGVFIPKWDRFSSEFLSRIQALGHQVKDLSNG